MRADTGALILAGGQARRMGGGDKCRLVVRGRTILDRTLDTVRPQAAALAINANGDPARFADTGLVVLPDSVPGHVGPLAGVLAGMDWAASLGLPWLLSVSGDCPFLPRDLVARLHDARGQGRFAAASSAGQAHPVIGLWPSDQADALRAALAAGLRKIDAFTGPIPLAEWAGPDDPFLNVNDPADLAEAERRRG